MFKRFVLINCPGLGAGDVRNSSGSNHSIEKLLRYSKDNDLVFDLSGIEQIGFDAFIKYQGASPRKSCITARLASRKVYGIDDFDAFTELGGGDDLHMPVFSVLSQPTSEDANDEVFVISIGNDESIVPAYEYIETGSDIEALEKLIDVVSAPLIRNELVVANLSDFREASMEGNPTLALACLVNISKNCLEMYPHLGTNDGFMFLSTTAIDPTVANSEFQNELTPMMFHSPTCPIYDLGLRLLSDVGPTIAEFFGRKRNMFIGASMGKWMFAEQYPQEEPISHIGS
ncbi:MAG: hypothetical protein U0R17_00480 [Acidimicrobiia bacterium]